MDKIATINEVQSILPDYSKSTVQRKIDLARTALSKEKPKLLLLSEFKKYFGLY